jgi:hypothetical protein
MKDSVERTNKLTKAAECNGKHDGTEITEAKGFPVYGGLDLQTYALLVSRRHRAMKRANHIPRGVDVVVRGSFRCAYVLADGGSCDDRDFRMACVCSPDALYQETPPH